MRRRERYSLILVALLICTCLLAGCKKETQATGEVREARFDENHTLVSLVVEDGAGKRVGVFVTGDTWVISLVDGFSSEKFQTEETMGTIITAYFGKDKQTVTEASGEKLDYYTAQQINITGVIERGAYVLSDGTSVDLIHNEFGNNVYCLEDGTNLLSVVEPVGPKNSYVGGLESLNDLPVAAQGKILSFYGERGLLYDEHEELERAYADYQARGANDFELHSVMQDVAPSAYNAQVIYFLTFVSLPAEESQEYCEFRMGDVFDRETGEHIDNTALFTCSPEEAQQVLLDAVCKESNDTVLRAEMDAAFNWESMVVTPSGIQITFPAGTLPSQAYSYIATVNFEEVSSILHVWVTPNSEK